MPTMNEIKSFSAQKPLRDEIFNAGGDTGFSALWMRHCAPSTLYFPNLLEYYND